MDNFKRSFEVEKRFYIEFTLPKSIQTYIYTKYKIQTNNNDFMNAFCTKKAEQQELYTRERNRNRQIKQ
jgi:hypothetical protein